MRKFIAGWIIIVTILAHTQCSIPKFDTYTRTVAVSSTEFHINKALVELTYITRDKALVERFIDARKVGDVSSQEFSKLTVWANSHKHHVVDITLNKFQTIEFYGK